MQMIDRKIMVVLLHCNHRQGKHHTPPAQFALNFAFCFIVNQTLTSYSKQIFLR